MKIEKAKLKDISEVERIYQECYVDEYQTQYPEMGKKKISNLIKDSKKRIQNFKKGVYGKDWLLLVAKEEEIIGFAQVSLKEFDKTIGFLNKVYILKNYRRKGIGEKLTKECLSWLKKKKVKEFESYVLIKNTASIKNLEKQGFEKYDYTMRKKIK